MPARSLANIELILNAPNSPLATDERVRCPECRKVIAEELEGRLTLTCPRCHHRVTITR